MVSCPACLKLAWKVRVERCRRVQWWVHERTDVPPSAKAIRFLVAMGSDAPRVLDMKHIRPLVAPLTQHKAPPPPPRKRSAQLETSQTGLEPEITIVMSDHLDSSEGELAEERSSSYESVVDSPSPGEESPSEDETRPEAPKRARRVQGDAVNWPKNHGALPGTKPDPKSGRVSARYVSPPPEPSDVDSDDEVVSHRQRRSRDRHSPLTRDEVSAMLTEKLADFLATMGMSVTASTKPDKQVTAKVPRPAKKRQ